MEIYVESFDGEKYTVEVGEDDTTEQLREKVASATGLCEDSFDMSFGGKLMVEGDYITQLSAGDIVVLTKTKSQKDDAIAALHALGETRLTYERFKDLTDPKLVHLFLQAGVVTWIPVAFLSGGTFEELDLSDVSVVTAVCHNFLSNCTSLHTADLSGWINVTEICRSFLHNCTGLTTIDLSGWNNVTKIESDFLSGCTSLTTLDISGWNNARQVGRNFLQNCSSLTTLDLSGWNVRHIENLVLEGCSSLTTVDSSGWNNVTQIPKSFYYRNSWYSGAFSGCTSLTTLDLSGWINVTQVGDNFLRNWSTLRTLDVSGWSNVTHVGDGFVRHCRSLRTLDWSGWASVVHIGQGVLKDCNLRKCSINVTGSSSVVSAYVNRPVKRDCVCM